MEVLEEYPRTYWLLERFVCTVLLCFVGVILRTCWRHMRANQRLALGDAFDYVASERRGLLLPVHNGGGRGKH